jgi:TRAP-type C4-dicarboxylate transport system permease large subunit
VLPVIVVVGLKFGVFTPTEAAVVAAVYALFVSTVIYKRAEAVAAVRPVRPPRRPPP